MVVLNAAVVLPEILTATTGEFVVVVRTASPPTTAPEPERVLALLLMSAMASTVRLFDPAFRSTVVMLAVTVGSAVAVVK